MTPETKAPATPEPSPPAQPQAPTTQLPAILITPQGREALRFFEHEIAAYRQALPRLLEEGEAGRHALIKGDKILSIWDTWRDASQVGIELFGPDAPMFIKTIDPRDLDRFALLDAQMAGPCQS